MINNNRKNKSGKRGLILPSDKFLDLSKLKALADNKINVTENFKLVLGKGENVGYQHFLLFPKCFQNAFLSGSLKVDIVW